MDHDHLIQRTTGFISSEGEKIYYETAGDRRRQALVFCHGLGGNHANWYQQVPQFASAYYVVTWDQRGFGRSTDRGREAGPEASTRDLTRLLDELQIQQTHLVGQSMGGWVALGWALELTDRAISLTLADTIAGIYTPETEKEFDRVLMQQARSRMESGSALPLGVHPAIGQALTVRDPAKAFLYQQLASLAPPSPANVPAQLRATSHALKDLNTMPVPALFIVGSDDLIFPPATIRKAAAQLPNSRVVEIPDTGHSPYFESPRAWNDTLADFLRSTSASDGAV